ncbi:MAG: efflux RND transporter periplasmic adaptor subunit, partial [Candidatus Marinimicrobia bacterium]|nr:efflux RND transporter periplasmic adaptor subunit [Candidatus Neomarinimicrobiota bacterium]
MKKRWIILGIILIAIIVVLVLRKPRADSSLEYTQIAASVEKVVEKYQGEKDPQSARRMIAEVQAVIDNAKRDENTREKLVIVPIQADRVITGQIQQKLTYLGNIAATSSARVFAKVPDRLVKFPVENGDYVKKGTLLAQVENTKLQQAVKQAEAAYASVQSQVKNLEQEFQRIKRLFDQNAVSESQYQQMETQLNVAKNGLKQAEAAYNLAKEQLADTYITAPIDGYVSGKSLSVGDMAVGQMPLVTLTAHDVLKINVDVIEKELQLIKKGQKANIYIDAFPGRVFKGHIANISPVINQMSRTGQVEILLENPDNLVQPGMFARIDIVIESKENALLVNRNNVDVKTIRKTNGNSIRNLELQEIYTVYIVKNDLALRRTIDVGIQSGMMMEVLSGLEPNDLIVSAGRANVQDSTM